MLEAICDDGLIGSSSGMPTLNHYFLVYFNRSSRYELFFKVGSVASSYSVRVMSTSTLLYFCSGQSCSSNLFHDVGCKAVVRVSFESRMRNDLIGTGVMVLLVCG